METFTGQIVKLTRMKNSEYGNPQYKIRVYRVADTVEFVTAKNASVGYQVYNGMLDKWATFVVSGKVRQAIIEINMDEE